jgi:hypothetical protein
MALLKSNERKELHLLTMVYKILYNIAPDYLNDLFTRMCDMFTIGKLDLIIYAC